MSVDYTLVSNLSIVSCILVLMLFIMYRLHGDIFKSNIIKKYINVLEFSNYMREIHVDFILTYKNINKNYLKYVVMINKKQVSEQFNIDSNSIVESMKYLCNKEDNAIKSFKNEIKNKMIFKIIYNHISEQHKLRLNLLKFLEKNNGIILNETDMNYINKKIFKIIKKYNKIEHVMKAFKTYFRILETVFCR